MNYFVVTGFIWMMFGVRSQQLKERGAYEWESKPQRLVIVSGFLPSFLCYVIN